jgi:outer membrane protein OmpA-like peptidoglycan-associated protein
MNKFLSVIAGLLVINACCHMNSKETTKTTEAAPNVAQILANEAGPVAAPAAEVLATTAISTFDVRPVFFETNSSQIKSEDKKYLSELATYLKQNPKAKVQIEGYTDASGSKARNLKLGQKRAEIVQNALLVEGVERQRLFSVNKGGEPAERKAVVRLVQE